MRSSPFIVIEEPPPEVPLSLKLKDTAPPIAVEGLENLSLLIFLDLPARDGGTGTWAHFQSKQPLRSMDPTYLNLYPALFQLCSDRIITVKFSDTATKEVGGTNIFSS